ncbi:hypothetical protein CANINC_003916 [Pichia inconspicua]|uniref:SHSP domain-containing protein n=1 Tax=Pichia inconspicua TaxID=52247 RepID=A0A4T0WXF9_9ASCO|nr:hypothetical protein CANINC_003916 [[Candida] inconspicua]
MDPFFREFIDQQTAAQQRPQAAQRPIRRAVYTFPVVDGDEGYDIGESYGYNRHPCYSSFGEVPQRYGYGHGYGHGYGQPQPHTHVYQQRPASSVYVAPVRLTNPLYFKLNHGPSETDADGDIEIGNDEDALEEPIPEEPEVLQRNPLIGGEPPSKRHAHAFVRAPVAATVPEDDSRYYGYVRPEKLEFVEPKKPEVQPVYIMDRFGNLYPYNGTGGNSEKKEIGANELINLLLGGGNDGDEKETEGEGVKNKEEEPLTKKDLADILTKIAEQDAKESEEEKVDAASETKSIPEPVSENTNALPSRTPLKKQPTVPELKVHSGTSTDSFTHESENDVKVSAPQLKSKKLPFSPPVNIYEFKSKYIVVVSIPGVSKEFVDIDYHPSSNELIIKGEAKNQYLSEDDEVANSFVLKLSEQRFGKFERVIKLPTYPGIEDSEIKARFKDGMLEIKLPKIDESKVKKTPKKIQLEEVADEELERESSSGLI